MKKMLSGSLAFVLAIAVVFASQAKAPQSTALQASFYWYNTSGSYEGLNTKSAEMQDSNCQDRTQVVCRNGFVESDLIDPAHPELGVKSSAQPDAVITRTN